MSKHFDDRLTIHSPSSNLTTHLGWTDGRLLTKHGIATIYFDPDFLRLDFAYKGVLHMRTIRRGFTDRGAAIMAGRFVREIVAAKEGKK